MSHPLHLDGYQFNCIPWSSFLIIVYHFLNSMDFINEICYNEMKEKHTENKQREREENNDH